MVVEKSDSGMALWQKSLQTLAEKNTTDEGSVESAGGSVSGPPTPPNYQSLAVHQPFRNRLLSGHSRTGSGVLSGGGIGLSRRIESSGSTPDLSAVVNQTMFRNRRQYFGGRNAFLDQRQQDREQQEKLNRFKNVFSNNTQVTEVSTDDTRPRIVMSAMDPMRAAFYNVTMALFSVCCVLALFGSYFLFYDFIKPALWAVICGIVLYPLKRLMTTVCQDWLDSLADDNTPLVLCILVTPVRALDIIGEFLLGMLMHQKYFVGILVASFPLFSLIINYGMIPGTIVILRRCMTRMDFFLAGFQSKLWLIPLVVYVLVIVSSSFFTVLGRLRSHPRLRYLRHPALSAVLWLTAIAHLCGYLGPMRSLGMFVTLALYVAYWRRDLCRFTGLLVKRDFTKLRLVMDQATVKSSSLGNTVLDRVLLVWESRMKPVIRGKIGQLQDKLGVTPIKSPEFRRKSPLWPDAATVLSAEKLLMGRRTPTTGLVNRKDRRKILLSYDDDDSLASTLDSKSTSSDEHRDDKDDHSESRDLLHEDTGYNSPAEVESHSPVDTHAPDPSETTIDQMPKGESQDENALGGAVPEKDGVSTSAEGDGADAESEEGAEEDDVAYIRYLLMACFFVYLSTRLYLLALLMIPLTFAVLKRLVRSFDIHKMLLKSCRIVRDQCAADADILIPAPIRSLFRYMIEFDKKIISVMRASMDMVGSLAALIIMIGLISSLCLFVALQLYYESVHIVTLASEVANHMMVHNERFREWILAYTHGRGGDNVTGTITELLQGEAKKLYQDYGETWISNQIKELTHGNETQADIIEVKIHTFLSSLYASFNPNESALIHHDGKLDLIAKVQEFDSAGDIFAVLYDNFMTIYEIFSSVWNVMVENAELVLGSIGGVLSSILSSGTAVMDFFLDTTVFLTILLGLLCSSGQQFKPLEVLQYLGPSKESVAEICRDIEEAVSGIFLATLKMAIFYGMFTWLTHTIFAVNLVFVPSVLAAIFAAIPFFGTTLVTIPAMLELWLVRGEPFLAVLLFIVHNVPGYFVDDAIFSGIKFCDPFLTGMSIAGGMLWWGLEGAIFGPILLCIFLVILSVYENLIAYQQTQADGTEGQPKSGELVDAS